MKLSILISFLLVISLSLVSAQQVPGLISYQGTVNVSGTPFDGQGTFMFAIMDEGNDCKWSIDGNWPPENGVDLTVNNGLFEVILGDRMEPILPGIFLEYEILYLRTWFNDQTHDWQQLEPDQQLTSVGFACSSAYAINAVKLQGHSANDFMDATTDNWVDTIGDTMTGPLGLGINNAYISASGNDLTFFDQASGVERTLTQLSASGTGYWNLNVSDLYYSGGRVGIGTSTPQKDLEVKGSDGLRIQSSTGATCRGDFYYAEGAGGLMINSSTGGSWADISFQTNGNTRMFLESAGRLGIGTVSPARRLEVYDSEVGYVRITSETTSGSYLELKGTGTGLNRTLGGINFLNSADEVKSQIKYIDASFMGTGGLGLYTEGSQVMKLTDDGRVGIGTSSPAAKLEIIGDGSSWQEGFIFIDNGVEDTGIRLYESGSVKHHIYNDTGFFDSLRILPDGNMSSGGITITQGGNVGIGTGTTIPTARFTVNGTLEIWGSAKGDKAVEIGKGLDYAEGFDVTETHELEPGTVLVIDANNPGHLTESTEPYDFRVAGIVAGANGLGSGVRLGPDEFDSDVALAGRVYCMAVAIDGPIEPGDLLTTSSVPGHAMKVTDPARSHGTILGKSMERLEKGQSGLILVLVALQ